MLKVTDRKNAIKFIEFQLDIYERLPYKNKLRTLIETLKLSRAALKEQEERENPKPLTLEELLAVNEEPVWVWFIDAPGRWVIRNALAWVDISYPERMALFNMRWYKHSAYGADWVAYRYKPKGG